MGMRWRSEKEVIAGMGQFSCSARGCSESRGLATFEVPFGYEEAGEKKQALVKVRSSSVTTILPNCHGRGRVCALMFAVRLWTASLVLSHWHDTYAPECSLGSPRFNWSVRTDMPHLKHQLCLWWWSSLGMCLCAPDRSPSVCSQCRLLKLMYLVMSARCVCARSTRSS